MKKAIKIVLISITGLACTPIYSQNNRATITTETRKVLYYQVEEYVNQSFGGTKTSYTVSDLSLISSDELGPDNVRTITPVYKKETITEKKYATTARQYREVRDPDALDQPDGARPTPTMDAPEKNTRPTLTPVVQSNATTATKKVAPQTTIVADKPKDIVATKTAPAPKKAVSTKTIATVAEKKEAPLTTKTAQKATITSDTKKDVVTKSVATVTEKRAAPITPNTVQKATVVADVKKEVVTAPTGTATAMEDKPLQSRSKLNLTPVTTKQEANPSVNKAVATSGTKPSNTTTLVATTKSEGPTEIQKPNSRNLTPVLKPSEKGANTGSRPVFTAVGKIEPTSKEIEERKVNEYVQTNENYNAIDEEAEKAAINALISNIKKEEFAANGEKKTAVYVNIIETYERVAEKGYRSAYVFRVIADSFYFSGKMDKAARWYTELFAMKPKLDPVYYYRYGAALKKTGNTEKGNAMIDKFSQMEEQ